MRRGRPLPTCSPYEIALWLEDAARREDNGAVRLLWSLLQREYFGEERWFELQQFAESVVRAERELEGQVAEMEEKASVLQRELADLQREIQAARQRLRELREGNLRPAPPIRPGPPGGDRAQPGVDPALASILLTCVRVRAGGKEGRLNTVMADLGLIPRGRTLLLTECLQLLIESAYALEVSAGNWFFREGTTWSSLEDIRPILETPEAIPPLVDIEPIPPPPGKVRLRKINEWKGQSHHHVEVDGAPTEMIAIQYSLGPEQGNTVFYRNRQSSEAAVRVYLVRFAR